MLTIPDVTALEAPPLSSITEVLNERSRQVTATQLRLWKFCEEYVLGTRLEVLVNSSSHALATTAVTAARGEIARFNRVFNHRRSDSEISQLNRAGRIYASADLFSVLQLSEIWRGISRGAFDGRMGELLRLWMPSIGTDAEPNHLDIGRALNAHQNSSIRLHPIEKLVELSSGVVLSLDAVAKGYIVDAALNAACRAAPAVEGLLISIGGDIRCWGKSPDSSGWRIGIADPIIPAENAPLVDAVSLSNAAIATSGRGPRDFIRTGNQYRSTTISPFTGRPVCDVISASVVASHAADADAIATACMVLHLEESLALVNKLDGVAARITDAQGQIHHSSGWPTIQLVATAVSKTVPPKTTGNTALKNTKKSTENSLLNEPSLLEQQWPADWEIGVVYSEPDRKDQKKATNFLTPYIAVWITDAQNKPVSTVFLLGSAVKWQRDNFIWWDSHSRRAVQQVEMRSRSTTLSGRYQMYWSGLDDDSKPVPTGKYFLHLETSQEHGPHTYRSVMIDIGRKRFKTALPNLADSGGLEITYGHYNDRFNSDD